MVVDALVNIVILLINALFLLFPTWSPPPSPGLTAFAASNIIIPWDTFITLFGVTIAFTLASLTLWGVNWVFNKLRGSG
jgi:hypothetical protein